MAEHIGNLILNPGTEQAGIIANGLKIGRAPLTDEYLTQHTVELTVIGEPTDADSPAPFRIGLHSILIDGREAYTFES